MTEKEFAEKYPFLFVGTSDDGTEIYTWIDSFPEGWWKAFGEKMCEEIQHEIDTDPEASEFCILEIKEKYGELRVYAGGSTNRIEEILDKYSFISRNVCIKCGKPDVPMVYAGWISPWCEDCWRENIAEQQRYLKTVHPDDPIEEYPESMHYEKFVHADESWKIPGEIHTKVWKPGADKPVERVVDISSTVAMIRDKSQGVPKNKRRKRDEQK